MNIAVDELARSVFKKSLSDCSVAELKQLTQQYPWFGPLHFLYTKKLQAGSTSIYDDQVQKTALYFNNRLWLQCLLNEREEEMVEVEKSGEWRVESGGRLGGVAEDEKEKEKQKEKESEGRLGGVVEDEKEKESEGRLGGDEEEKEKEKEKESEGRLGGVVEDEKEKEKEKEKESEGVEEDEREKEMDETEDATLPPMPTINFQPAPTMNTPLTFEPYHTVDYFASQGIKFREDEKPKDRFGQQLKSFTEWLKAMKRVAPAEIATSTGDPTTEKKVEQMAEHSLAERHIITEAMAEVWIKQGNTAKAEEIYRKLSLLDPGKTAYFAARIEDLKKTR